MRILRMLGWLLHKGPIFFLVALTLSGWGFWKFYYPSDKNTDALARNLYWEAIAARQPLYGVYMVGYVTMARSWDDRSDWGGATISGVVYHSKQFSWTGTDVKEKEAQRPGEWFEAVLIARIMRSLPKPTLEFLAGSLADVRYYYRISDSSRGGLCWIETHTEALETVGDHVFAREVRSPQELAELAVRYMSTCRMADYPVPPRKPIPIREVSRN